jgi:asparagine synthase (glutamine-hydrolysing)
MCGLVGFFKGSHLNHHTARNVLRSMADAIGSRGPDGSGYWFDEKHRIGFGHRRLAILDLSSAGHQPMLSASGRYVIAFNGEIYNHIQCREALGASVKDWHGNSDTETLLAGFDAWGIEATVKRCIGMFAFAVWDRHQCTLTLARDRLGEKPLYYGWQGKGSGAVFLFGSELKALKKHPQFAATIDRNSICQLMRHNYIPSPYSIYDGISKLGAGCLLTLSVNRPDTVINCYWSAVDTARDGIMSPFTGTSTDAVDALEDILKSAVRQQMLADVPLGAFLSGGIDSSTIVALMQHQSHRPVKTFTIGFNEQSYNEAGHAKAVAQHLGTDHTELYVSSRQAQDVIHKLPILYCEPFSDSSQIPTILVSELARQKVVVSLSGDGGDELFGGYKRYVMANRLWKQLLVLPVAGRRLVANCIRSVSPKRWNQIIDFGQIAVPQSLRQVNVGDKLHKAADVLGVANLEQLYFGLVSHWKDPARIVIGGDERPTVLSRSNSVLNELDDIQRMMLLDTLAYLPDDILVKVDRAAMSVSLESRVPFLDHRVFEFAWKLPQNLKLRDGVGKWVLREVLFRHVPKTLIDRPKMGFGVPIGDWLRGPLRGWAESLIDESRLNREGYFKPAPIRQMWFEHLSGTHSWQYHLWDVLMFQAWLEKNCNE